MEVLELAETKICRHCVKTLKPQRSRGKMFQRHTKQFLPELHMVVKFKNKCGRKNNSENHNNTCQTLHAET